MEGLAGVCRDNQRVSNSDCRKHGLVTVWFELCACFKMGGDEITV